MSICPCCTNTFDPHHAEMAFIEKRKGHKIGVIYALCPNCTFDFELGTSDSCVELMKKCFANVRLSEDSAAYTVTTTIALEANGGKFYPAWANGVDIPKPLFDAIDAGIVDDYTIFCGCEVQGAIHAE